MIKRFLGVASDRAGAALVEFTFVLPALLLIMLGVVQFGLLFYNYIMVTEAAAVGARQLSISRLDPTGKPYTDTVNAIIASTSLKPALASANITLSVAGSSCSTDTTCQSELSSAYGTSPAGSAGVKISYSCSILMPTYLINLTGICPLNATMQQPVQ